MILLGFLIGCAVPFLLRPALWLLSRIGLAVEAAALWLTPVWPRTPTEPEEEEYTYELKVEGYGVSMTQEITEPQLRRILDVLMHPGEALAPVPPIRRPATQEPSAIDA